MAFIGDAVAHAVFPGLAIAFIVSVSLDRETARAQGIPVLFFDLLLYVAVSLAVVMSVQTIGNVLVLALPVTPAATARLLVDRLTHMIFLSALIAVMGSFWGIYLSWAMDLPMGATIVCLLTFFFICAWIAAPGHGLIAYRLSECRLRNRGANTGRNPDSDGRAEAQIASYATADTAEDNRVR